MIAPAEPTTAPPAPAPPQETESDRIRELQATVSASRLNSWQQCRLKFYFHYVRRIPKGPTAALHVGSVVHAVLQAWNMARWRKAVFQLALFKNIFETKWVQEQAEKKINWEDEEPKQQNQAWALLETYFLQTPIKANEMPEAVEVPVETDLKKHGLPILVGIMDLVRSGGRIVDFKTSGQTPNPEKVIHQHETQTSCYAVLYREAAGKQEGGIELHHLVKLKTPKVVITEAGSMKPEQQVRLFRVMESYMEGLARKDFIPSPGLHCAACEYFNECRRWC
jgi:putative RecB family exonuclease